HGHFLYGRFCAFARFATWPDSSPSCGGCEAGCGRCGRRMSLRYQNRRGRVNPTYYCQRQATEYGGALCQQIPGGCVDQAISRLVVEALTHEAVEVALAVYEELGRQHDELATIHRDRIQRARHEADLAEPQFLLANPQNRPPAA